MSPRAKSSKSTSMTVQRRKCRIPKTKMELVDTKCLIVRIDFYHYIWQPIYLTQNTIKLMSPNAKVIWLLYDGVNTEDQNKNENCSPQKPSRPSWLPWFFDCTNTEYRIPKTKMEVDAPQCRVVKVDLHGSTTTQIPNTENGNGNWSHPMLSRPSRPTWFYDLTNTE